MLTALPLSFPALRVKEVDAKEEQDDIDADYIVDEKAKTATLTPHGQTARRGLLQGRKPVRPRRIPRCSTTSTRPSRRAASCSATWTTSSSDGQVIIVDEFTGRLMFGRRYNEGLHQAIEAKEGRQGRAGEQDPGDHHLPELLPSVQQAVRYDRYRADRGKRVPRRSISWTSSRSRPTSPMIRKDQPGRGLQERTNGKITTPLSSRSSSATKRVSRFWSARFPSKSPRSCRKIAEGEGHPAHRPQREVSREAKRRSLRRPASSAQSPLRPTWQAAVPISCSAATPSTMALKKQKLAQDRTYADERAG